MSRGGRRPGAGRRKGSRDKTPRARLAAAFREAINALPVDARIDLLVELRALADSKKLLDVIKEGLESPIRMERLWTADWIAKHAYGNAPQRPQPPPAVQQQRVELVFNSATGEISTTTAGKGPRALIQTSRLIPGGPQPADPAVEGEPQAEAVRPPAAPLPPTSNPRRRFVELKPKPDTCTERDREDDDPHSEKNRWGGF